MSASANWSTPPAHFENSVSHNSGAQPPHNKQLQRTVPRYRGRGARASFHYARAPRFIGQRAAAELRR